jgi:hypothetical protein
LQIVQPRGRALKFAVTKSAGRNGGSATRSIRAKVWRFTPSVTKIRASCDRRIIR